MKTACLLPLLTAILACSACGPAIDISNSFDSNADFTALKSYAWASGSRLNLVEPSDNDAAIEAAIQAAVDRELAAKGYTKTSSGSADFLVGYAGASNKSLRSQTVNRHYGYDPYFADPAAPASAPGGAGRRDLYLQEFSVGSLVIDISNRKSKKLVWRGVAKTTLLKDPTPARSQQRINEAVREMLSGFPPQ